MPIVRDFRAYSFDQKRIDRCGRFIGREVYWKLYAVENLLRIFLHSALSAQIHAEWWDVAVDPSIRKSAERVLQRYLRRPWHTYPGGHRIYYVFLSDLNQIIRANSNLLLPLVPDIDHWILRIEEIRLPRNLVGHMNFLGLPDRHRVDHVYADSRALISQLETRGLALLVP